MSVVFAVGTVAYAIRESRPHADPLHRLHPPSSADERAAAQVAESFAAAVARRDTRNACRLSSGVQSVELRCGRDGEPEWPDCRAKAAVEAIETDTSVEVTIENCRLRIVRLPDGWRVVEDLGLIAIA